MIKKIIYAYALSIIIGSASGSIVLSLINGILLDGDIIEVILYFFRGLILSIFLLPVLITLLIVASRDKEMEYNELRNKLHIAHLFSVIVFWILGNVIFYQISGGISDFFGIQFGISIVIMGIYALFSYIGWKIAFKSHN